MPLECKACLNTSTPARSQEILQPTKHQGGYSIVTHEGKKMLARLSLGLLLLALVLPMQIYSFVPLTSTPEHTVYSETTVKPSDNAIQNIASTLVVLLVLLYLIH
jgi:hypothetical protein